MAQAKGYTLVLMEPGLSPTVFDLAPSPEDVRSEKTALTTLIPLPNLSVYREGHGNGLETITMKGSFGYKKRQVGGVNWTGTQLFLAFRKGFWDKYQALFGSPDPFKNKVKVEFHNWDEDEHYYAEPISFVTPRGSENRTFFKYEFTLNLYAPIKRKIEAPITDPRTEASQISKFLKSVSEKLKQAGEWLRDKAERVQSILNREVLQPIAELTSALDTFVSGTTSIVLMPLRQVNRIANKVSTLIEELGTITGKVLTETANTLRNTRRALLRLTTKSGSIFKQSINDGLEELSNQYFQLVDEENDTETVQEEKRSGRNQALAQQAARIRENTYTGAQRATIRDEDTLQKIALRYLGDSSKWREIALLNGLDDTDLTSLAGTEILVPTLQPAIYGSGVVGDLSNDEKINNTSMAERLYGRDLRLVESEGKFSVVFESNNDLATIGGNQNLLQAISLKTRVKQGQLLENQEFGLPHIIGKKATSSETLLLKHGLQVTAETDPRVDRAEVEVEREGNVTSAKFTIYPAGVAGSRPLNTVVGRV